MPVRVNGPQDAAQANAIPHPDPNQVIRNLNVIVFWAKVVIVALLLYYTYFELHSRITKFGNHCSCGDTEIPEQFWEYVELKIASLDRKISALQNDLDYLNSTLSDLKHRIMENTITLAIHEVVFELLTGRIDSTSKMDLLETFMLRVRETMIEFLGLEVVSEIDVETIFERMRQILIYRVKNLKVITPTYSMNQ